MVNSSPVLALNLGYLAAVEFGCFLTLLPLACRIAPGREKEIPIRPMRDVSAIIDPGENSCKASAVLLPSGGQHFHLLAEAVSR